MKCSAAGPRKELIEKWIYWQLVIMYPITPHYNEMAYIENFLPSVDGSKYPKNLIEAKMPIVQDAEINQNIIDAYDYLSGVLRNIRLGYMKAKDMKKGKKKQQTGEEKQISKVIIIWAKEKAVWQMLALQALSEAKFDKDGNCSIDYKTLILSNTQHTKEEKGKAMQYAAMII